MQVKTNPSLEFILNFFFQFVEGKNSILSNISPLIELTEADQFKAHELENQQKKKKNQLKYK